MSTKTLYYTAWHIFPGHNILGLFRKHLILQHLNYNLEVLFNLSLEEFKKLVEKILEVKWEYNISPKDFLTEAQKTIDKAFSFDLKVCHIDAKGYPQLLSSIPAAPFVLFCNKEFLPELNNSITVLASRTTFSKSTNLISKISDLISKHHLSLVTDIVQGIPQKLIESAFKTGLKIIYPAPNGIYSEKGKLLRYGIPDILIKLLDEGWVITEYPIGYPTQKYTIYKRLRLLTGLGLVTIILQASAKSGLIKLIDFAKDQGRQVIVLNWGENTPEGNLKLHKKGAIAVHPEELEEVLLSELKITKELIPTQPYKSLNTNIFETEDEELVYNIMECNKLIHTDEIIHKSNIQISKIIKILIKLQLKGLCESVPGGYYIKKC